MKNGTKEIPDGGSCNANIVPNETFYLTAEPKPSDVDERDVVWSAESENVATVSATGKVTVTAPKVSSSGGGGGSAHYANPTNSSSYHGVTYHAGTSSDPYRYHNNCGCYF